MLHGRSGEMVLVGAQRRPLFVGRRWPVWGRGKYNGQGHTYQPQRDGETSQHDKRGNSSSSVVVVPLPGGGDPRRWRHASTNARNRAMGCFFLAQDGSMRARSSSAYLRLVGSSSGNCQLINRYGSRLHYPVAPVIKRVVVRFEPGED